MLQKIQSQASLRILDWIGLDDELVEVKDTAIEEVLERRESEVDDLILVVVD